MRYPVKDNELGLVREVYFESIDWVSPKIPAPIFFVTMSAGAGSGARKCCACTNSKPQGGQGGDFTLNYPLILPPKSVVKIVIGTGGKATAAYATGTIGETGKPGNPSCFGNKIILKGGNGGGLSPIATPKLYQPNFSAIPVDYCSSLNVNLHLHNGIPVQNKLPIIYPGLMPCECTKLGINKSDCINTTYSPADLTYTDAGGHGLFFGGPSGYCCTCPDTAVKNSGKLGAGGAGSLGYVASQSRLPGNGGNGYCIIQYYTKISAKNMFDIVPPTDFLTDTAFLEFLKLNDISINKTTNAY